MSHKTSSLGNEQDTTESSDEYWDLEREYRDE